MIRSANACKVYALVDETGRVQAINSSAFLRGTEGWTLIDEGSGDKYHHAQGNYMPLPIHDERGVCRYKLADGAVVERTEEEMQADYEAMTANPEPTADERIAALEDELKAAKILLGVEV